VGNKIVIVEAYLDETWVIRHEMLHAILQRTDHRQSTSSGAAAPSSGARTDRHPHSATAWRLTSTGLALA
jgi:hypothetical protein